MGVMLNLQPEVLKWLRNGTGITHERVAAKLKVEVTEVISWETNGASLSVSKTRDLANLFKRPLAAFLLEAPPSEDNIPNDLRSLPSERGSDVSLKEFSEKTLLALRKAAHIRESIAELSEALPVEIPRVTRAGNPDLLAQKVREELRVSIEDQIDWPDAKAAFRAWSSVLERQGIIVLELKMDIEDARGFALYGTDELPPVIGINYSDSWHGKCFSLFHEYAHLIIPSNGIQRIDGNTVYYKNSISNIEQFCNKFAASFLLPQRLFLSDPLVQKNDEKPVWKDRVLARLSNKYKVSKEVVLRRLLEFNQTTQDFYRMKRAEWSSRPIKTPTMVVRRMPQEVARQNGFYFTSTVINAMDKRKIGPGEAVEYLETNTKHLKGIREVIRSW